MRGPLKTKEELKEETGKILQEEKETFERAAEKSAALEGKKKKEALELSMKKTLEKQREAALKTFRKKRAGRKKRSIFRPW